MGIRCADHVTSLYPQKLALTSPTGGGCFIGIVRSRTKATVFSLIYPVFWHKYVEAYQTSRSFILNGNNNTQANNWECRGNTNQEEFLLHGYIISNLSCVSVEALQVTISFSVVSKLQPVGKIDYSVFCAVTLNYWVTDFQCCTVVWFINWSSVLYSCVTE